MNKRNLRTQIALKIAPWLKPGAPVAREWKISGPAEKRSDERAVFRINRLPFQLPATPITGRELRDLPLPPISEDEDLWQAAFTGEDHPVSLDDELTIHPGDEFYSAPKYITAGAPSEVTWKGSWADRVSR